MIQYKSRIFRQAVPFIDYKQYFAIVIHHNLIISDGRCTIIALFCNLFDIIGRFTNVNLIYEAIDYFIINYEYLF